MTTAEEYIKDASLQARYYGLLASINNIRELAAYEFLRGLERSSWQALFTAESMRDDAEAAGRALFEFHTHLYRRRK